MGPINSMVARWVGRSQGIADHPQYPQQIETQISATDRRIDRLVYELYDLTDEEVALVEGPG